MVCVICTREEPKHPKSTKQVANTLCLALAPALLVSDLWPPGTYSNEQLAYNLAEAATVLIGISCCIACFAAFPYEETVHIILSHLLITWVFPQMRIPQKSSIHWQITPSRISPYIVQRKRQQLLVCSATATETSFTANGIAWNMACQKKCVYRAGPGTKKLV